ncbi:lipopolysaccharide transport periplasmic protein LptA [Paracoccus sp. R12_1]|jgi:lipopolysaccharide export system protein LptA|uniref:lipopolysaccharide transport periplasmic protein LptA n=1 Tax=unclassified Paracoccus (in: a-proteobacteria) TaxID=2688777 RepID=UPI000C0ADA24|nr:MULTISPECIES: lipopolysaccharide transport periplasmic protein LptA [unclassified Paracoccus (in: a-proteobacteria)]MBO9453604.1 lipopolysaccharide transport periplasmic protein LptA [Paracoccus sp. R12_2]MBO9486972.1 lipopolysaccharide transport periplasmic protein LptA [Paracoccus sp. R12_1]PHQ69677.1 MAG: lipopolysaccharide transport periplasmic protein LptA [Paracoccus sp. (in: a-proteobacteria)]
MLRPLTIALLLAAAPATAQNIAFGGVKADTSAQVEVAADSLSVNQSDGSAVFTGNVVIGQGDMRLSAETVTVEYAEGGQNRIRSLHATGSVTLVSGADAAEAREAVYDVESGNVTLTGDVVMTQGRNALTGDKMVVNLVSGTAQVDGRVRSVLQPEGN